MGSPSALQGLLEREDKVFIVHQLTDTFTSHPEHSCAIFELFNSTLHLQLHRHFSSPLNKKSRCVLARIKNRNNLALFTPLSRVNEMRDIAIYTLS